MNPGNVQMPAARLNSLWRKFLFALKKAQVLADYWTQPSSLCVFQEQQRLFLNICEKMKKTLPCHLIFPIKTIFSKITFLGIQVSG